MQHYAIFLSGPIGAGKTTLGKGLAAELGGGFIDGDDHSDPDLPWYGSILQTSRSVVRTGLEILAVQPVVVIAYPLGCSTWIFYKRHFADAGVRPFFVSLRASYTGITSAARGRAFDKEERERIRVMLHEGYAERPFSDLIIDTDLLPFEAALQRLARDVRQLIAA
ncbi:AAA family ATPase [Bosea sp. BIWAKO-01]|uniref:AAA family ATPase n=1 Tax=Bosea sp. BIWAKO-01 TaxID=506668 RepID=UPI000852A2B9|nr:AAA family ATPase [Bosea sp. BIWAKO-01]GAU83291.1 hypothetical protein BIWAKO_03215 [Bosea sp. BIWAKO-01]